MSQGVYNTSNFTFNYDIMIPMREEVKFRVTLKFIGLKKDKKSPSFATIFIAQVKGAVENKVNVPGIMKAIEPSF